MLKQMVPTCVCGQMMYFPAGETKFQCPKCPTIWDRNYDGYWAESGLSLMFTPILTEPKRLTTDGYPRYPRSKKRRKAVKKC